MKLTYWVATCLDDHRCYSVRGKTKKSVVEQLGSFDAESFGKPHKVTVEYESAFDLLVQCMQEGSINEGEE
jgi:hypothetical protein